MSLINLVNLNFKFGDSNRFMELD